MKTWLWSVVACGVAATLGGCASNMDLKRISEAAVMESGGRALPYRLFAPDAVRPDHRYPLVVFLHGAGERGTDNAAQLKHGVADILRFSREHNEPCYLLAPQCPAGVWWMLPPAGGAPAGDEPFMAVLALTDRLLAEKPIDPQRIYITGLSMGGFGTWAALELRPGFFAAAVPICGGGRPAAAAGFAKVPVWAFHGADDPVVPPLRSREMVDALRAAGAKPGYTEYPGVGHDSWIPAYRDAVMLSWMFKQRRAK